MSDRLLVFVKAPRPGAEDHYGQFVEACRGNGRTSTPFDYAGNLTESILLGCLAGAVTALFLAARAGTARA